MSCVIVLVTVPPIVRVARAKHIFDETDHRKIHTNSVPNLGGISLFMAITITSAILTVGHPAPGNQVLYAAMILLFFVGIKDDIIFISANTKFLIQLATAFILVVLGNHVIGNFEGILGLQKVPPIVGETFTIVFIVLLINAYNLIDGIDGLAGLLGLIASLFFAVWFFANNLFFLSILSTAIVGSLIGFLRFNLFGKEYKIFMGDTGSLLLGLLMAMQVIWFLTNNLTPNIPFHVNSAPVIALSLIALPLIDTLRVFTLRIIRGQPPFYPDKNHIHHRTLSFLPKHFHSSLSIAGANLFIIACAILLSVSGLNINHQFLIILFVSIAISILPGYMVSKIMRKQDKTTTPIIPFSELELKVMNYNLKYKGKTVKFPKEEKKKEKEKEKIM